MMGHFASMIVTASKITRGYAERLLVGVSARQFARTPSPGGVNIRTNHPAWVFGHLALYPARVAGMVGIDPAQMIVPAEFEPLFKDGTDCKDDPEASIYPTMESITSAYFRAHDALYAALPGVEDAVLLAPTTDEKARLRFPTVGPRVLFMCNNHITMHLGQVSAWRRCMGLPAA